MQWKVLSISPGENPEDVVVRVAYWYSENSRRRRVESSADFVEDHHIQNIPTRSPRTDERGMLIRKDGGRMSPWVERDGDWVLLDTNAVADEIEWDQFSDEQIEALIQDPLRQRAERVNEERPDVGRDVFPEGHLPEQATDPDAIARRPNVSALRDVPEVI